MSKERQIAPVTIHTPQGQRAQELFAKIYDSASLSREAALFLNEHPDLEHYLRSGLRRYSLLICEQIMAQSLIGSEFIRWEDVERISQSVFYTSDELETLRDTFPSSSLVRWCINKDFIIVPPPPCKLTALQLRDLPTSRFAQKKSWEWFTENSFFSEEKTQTGWYVIKKTPISESEQCSWDEQEQLLQSSERVPNVAELAWVVSIYFHVRGVRLFENVYVRTSSISQLGNHVYFGCHEQDGFILKEGNDGYRGGNVCLTVIKTE